MNYQARIQDSFGTSVADGTYVMKFKIYSASSGGAAVWEETHASTITKGLVSVRLGTQETINLNFNSGEFYLGVTIGSDSELSPRVQFGAVPYAINSQRLDGKTVGTGASNVLGLTSSGAIDIAGTIKTTGDLDAGTSTLDRLTVETTGNFLQGLTVTDLTVSSGVRIGTGSTPNDLVALGDDTLFVEGATEIDGGLFVDGAVDLDSTINVAGASTLTGAVTTGVALTVGTDLTVTSGARVGTGSTPNDLTALADDTLFVEGLSEFDGNMFVDGAVDLDSTINVAGGSTLTGAVSTGADATVGTDLTVTSGARVGTGSTPNLFTALADDSLFVEGQLEVDAAARFDSTIDANGAIDLGGGVTNSAGEFLFSGGNLQLNDSINLTVGTGDDLTIVHNGTNTILTSATGTWQFDNTLATGTTLFTLGTDTAATSFVVEGDGGTDRLTVTGAGVVTIAGLADGTDALVMTAGDIMVSNGDLEVAAGDFSVGLDDGDTANIDGDTSPTTDLLDIGFGDTSVTNGVDGLSISLRIGAATSGNSLLITSTLGAQNGLDEYAAIDINVTGADHTGTGNSIAGLDLGLTTPDAQSFESGILFDPGWDADLVMADGGTLDIADEAGNVLLTIDDDGTYATILPGAADLADLGSTTREMDEVYVGDNAGLQLGLDQDAQLMYDELTDDRVELGGSGAGLYVEDTFTLGRQTLTMATVGAATENLAVAASYVEVTGQDNAADIVQVQAAGASEGDILYITNLDATNIAIDQTATTKLSGGADVTLTQYDVMILIFDGTNWLQAGSVTNNS